MSKITIKKIQSWKNKKKFSAITAYDFTSAKIINQTNIPIILVGDSASMISYGYSSTVPISMDEIILVTRAVSRATSSSFVVGDMPFGSYQRSVSIAVKNATRFLKEGGASAVKLEGGILVQKQINKIVDFGIPVMGHVGLTPQSVNQLSGYSVQGKGLKPAQKILDDARAVEDAGAFAVVLECIPTELAKKITSSLSIPTIGIGSGKYCDGQIQVLNDVLGLNDDFFPKHAKRYLSLQKSIVSALKKYNSEVVNSSFPQKKHSTSYKKNIIDKLV
tara:strand:- start:648 stop:1475 length:828 start_codon:yes stop_codon:yes gene_type:complete